MTLSADLIIVFEENSSLNLIRIPKYTEKIQIIWYCHPSLSKRISSWIYPFPRDTKILDPQVSYTK